MDAIKAQAQYLTAKIKGMFPQQKPVVLKIIIPYTPVEYVETYNLLRYLHVATMGEILLHATIIVTLIQAMLIMIIIMPHLFQVVSVDDMVPSIIAAIRVTYRHRLTPMVLTPMVILIFIDPFMPILEEFAGAIPHVVIVIIEEILMLQKQVMPIFMELEDLQTAITQGI